AGRRASGHRRAGAERGGVAGRGGGSAGRRAAVFAGGDAGAGGHHASEPAAERIGARALHAAAWTRDAAADGHRGDGPGVPGPLVGGRTYTGVVAKVQAAAGTPGLRVPIPADGVVLAGRGPEEVLLEDLRVGEWVQFRVDLAPPFDQAV